MPITRVPHWGLLLALAGAECLLMMVLALLCWRRNARSPGRMLNYVLGSLGLLAGLGAWAAGTRGPVAPGAVPVVYAALLAGAGAGTVIPRVILIAQAHAAVREAAAEEGAHA